MGTLRRAVENLIGWRKVAYTQHLVGNSVLFSAFGNDITASDVAKTAIHRVAEAVSKCGIKSVIEKQNPHRIDIRPNDDINVVLSGRVNPLCGLKDFLYKVAYLAIVNKNCFIYWAYDEVPIEGTDKVRRITRGFYPIENAAVKLYYAGDEMRIELASIGGSIVLDCPYSDIIHIRHSYGANAYFGGGKNGHGEYKDLLGNLQTMQVIHEAIPKSLEASLSLKGILSMKTVADVDKKTISREEFEQHLFDSKYGIVATDYESDFTPININSTDIPSNILTFLRDEILAPFGVSLPIWLGKYTDSEYTAFYQTAVEGLLMSIAEAMKITLFTPRQLAYGHTIKYYDKLVQSLSFERRQQIAELTKDDALLSRDERRELLGYEPDGQPTRVSLNYIDATLANEYQMAAIYKPATNATPAQTNPEKKDADAPDKKEGNTDVD